MEPPSGSALCGFVNQAGTPTSLPLTLDCGAYGTIASVTFASYGRPHGWCGSLTPDATCAYPNSAAVVAAACVGKPSCSVPADGAAFGGYTCPGNGGVSLAAQVTCSGGGNFTSWDFSYVDPGMLDFFDAAKGRTMIPNFSTPPQVSRFICWRARERHQRGRGRGLGRARMPPPPTHPTHPHPSLVLSRSPRSGST